MLRVSFMAATLISLGLFTAAPAQAADVKQAFNFYCAQCHAADGKGKGINVTPDIATTPRDFTNKVDMAKRTDEDIRAVIKGGGPSISKSALMPPWGKTMSEAEIDQMVAYVRAFSK